MSKIFAIFGNPVSHSISPLIHNYTMKSLGIETCYSRIKLEQGKDIRDKFYNLHISGANITVPFKEDAFMLCDRIEGVANDIQAVNTIVKKDNKLIGYNTDAPGFYESIKEFKDVKNVLILGAGGTAKAISVYLKYKGYRVSILNRSSKRVEFFKERGFDAYEWRDFKPSGYDMIINTTSAGLNEETLPFDKERLEDLFKDAKYAVDVIYNKQTPFLKLAKNHKLQTKDGKEMLIFQAILAFEIFFDFQYEKEDIQRYMFKASAIL